MNKLSTTQVTRTVLHCIVCKVPVTVQSTVVPMGGEAFDMFSYPNGIWVGFAKAQDDSGAAFMVIACSNACRDGLSK